MYSVDGVGGVGGLRVGVGGVRIGVGDNDGVGDVDGGSNYDSLFVRTVAFPVQVAYWIQRS